MLRSGWLSDILPQSSGSASASKCKAATSGGADPAFVLDSDCSITAKDPSSGVEFLYACATVQQGNTPNERRAYEAVDRLRIKAPIDTATGLYRH